MKVYRVVNGEIDEQTRDLAGPYFNRNAHISTVTARQDKDVFKK